MEPRWSRCRLRYSAGLSTEASLIEGNTRGLVMADDESELTEAPLTSTELKHFMDRARLATSYGRAHDLRRRWPRGRERLRRPERPAVHPWHPTRVTASATCLRRSGGALSARDP